MFTVQQMSSCLEFISTATMLKEYKNDMTKYLKYCTPNRQINLMGIMWVNISIVKNSTWLEKKCMIT